MTIELSNGEKWEMREPKVRDMKIVENITSVQARERKLIVNLCEISEDELDDLSMKDYVKLREALDSFL